MPLVNQLACQVITTPSSLAIGGSNNNNLTAFRGCVIGTLPNHKQHLVLNLINLGV